MLELLRTLGSNWHRSLKIFVTGIRGLMAIILAAGRGERTVGSKLAWATKWHKTNTWLLTDGNNNLAPAVFFGFTESLKPFTSTFSAMCTLG